MFFLNSNLTLRDIFSNIQSLYIREKVVWKFQSLHTRKIFFEIFNLSTPGKSLSEIFNLSKPKNFFGNFQSLHTEEKLVWNFQCLHTRKTFFEIFNLSTPGIFSTPWKINLWKRNTPAEGGRKFSFVGSEFPERKVFLAQRGRSGKKNVVICSLVRRKRSHENAVKLLKNFRIWPFSQSTFHVNPTNIRKYTSLWK